MSEVEMFQNPEGTPGRNHKNEQEIEVDEEDGPTENPEKRNGPEDECGGQTS